MSKTQTQQNGWQNVQLGDVVKFGNGKARPKDDGAIPIYGGNRILGYTSSSNYDGETIILDRVGAYCGSVYKSKKLSDMLDAAIKKYQNNLLTAAQVIEELINIAKEIKASDERGEDLGLTEDEIAFYDALAINGSAKEVLGDDTLRELARILVQKVKANTAIDWTIKESVQAKLRVIVKRILRQYGYPPDKQKLATENILKQAELFAGEWSS